MKFFVFGDLQGNLEVLDQISRLDLSAYHFAVFTGDLLAVKQLKTIYMKRVIKSFQPSPEQFAQVARQEVKTLNALTGKLLRIRRYLNIYGVWGNADLTPLIASSRITQQNPIVSLHMQPRSLDGIVLIGYNGRPMYNFEADPTQQVYGIQASEAAASSHAFEEDLAYDDLSKLFLIQKDPIVLVTHSPPYGILDKVSTEYLEYATKSYGETASKGHIGSIALRSLVDEFKPKIHIFGHVHESKGMEQVGGTLAINVGCVGQDRQVVEIEVNRECTARFIKLP